MSHEQLPLDLGPLGSLSVADIWRLATPELLAKLREDRRIERKPIGIHWKELAEYFSMWANGPEGGLIVVGMEDDGSFSGCSTKPDYPTKLETHAHDCCPDAKVQTRQIEVTNTKGNKDFIVVFRVLPCDNKVVLTVESSAFVRIGHTKRKLKSEEIRELEADRGQVFVEQELCPAASFPDDFDQELLAEYIATIRERTDYPDHLSGAEVLELRRLGKRKGDKFIPNAACVLAFAIDPVPLFPGCKVRFLRHEGVIEGTGEKWNVVKDNVIEGNLPYLIKNTEILLRSQLRDFSRLGPDGKFYTAAEYPKAAWIEALVNALVHRSYGSLKNMNVFIRMFDDRLEFESPGGFPPPVNPENIYEMHHPRNPILMDAMMFLKYAKCAREGTRRMRETMAESNLPVPVFAQKEMAYSLVRVTLRNNIKQREIWIDSDVTSLVGEEIAKTLNDIEKRAVNFVAEHRLASVSEISRLLHRDWKTTQKLLMRLEARQVLIRIGRRDIDRDPKARFAIRPRPVKATPPERKPT